MKILNRAKSLYGNDYIISVSAKFEFNQMYLYSKPFKQWVECDESTRSINFEDMKDNEGTKIFASLSEDGKGGDIITSLDNTTAIMTMNIYKTIGMQK